MTATRLPDPELRHPRRARAEDRIRAAEATGVTAWTRMLALTDHRARRWEPERLRLRLFAVAGRIARHARRVHLRPA